MLNDKALKSLFFEGSQHSAFKNEIASLTHKEQSLQLIKKRPILNVDLLIDDHRLRSVGERLENSTVPFDVKHLIAELCARSAQRSTMGK